LGNTDSFWGFQIMNWKLFPKQISSENWLETGNMK
jgi:hypothetical protein